MLQVVAAHGAYVSKHLFCNVHLLLLLLLLFQAGKAAGLFTSTATQGGGQETTLFTAVTQLAHHGMVFVPSGYGTGQIMFGMDEPRVSRL